MSPDTSDALGLRSLLFAPANDERKALHFPDLEIDRGVLDLEDAVARGAKAQARETLATLLPRLVGRLELMVRINPVGSPFAEDDLATAVEGGVRTVVVPKVSSTEEVERVDGWLSRLERAGGLEDRSVRLVPVIETAQAVLGAPEIAAASGRILTVVLGTVDLAAELGISQMATGDELSWARSHVVLAAGRASRPTAAAPGISASAAG
jgi:citrate lyase subunit beta/citryl-CoA lyase